MAEYTTSPSDNDYTSLHDLICRYASSKQLDNTLASLSMMQELVKNGSIDSGKYYHCLMVCRMIIDLNIELTSDEEDILLAASVCHIIPEEMPGPDPCEQLICRNNLDHKIYDIVMLLNLQENADEDELQTALEKIQENRLAMLIALTDRGNIVEQLYDMSSWQVRRFIYETRRYYFPVCIYAKEHYHELLSPVGILLEKLRNLTDVSEALLYRFEDREIEITREILALREENATIRGIINRLTD